MRHIQVSQRITDLMPKRKIIGVLVEIIITHQDIQLQEKKYSKFISCEKS
jgi:hypothetical protein